MGGTSHSAETVRVSVVIACFNVAAYLDETLKSVRSQTLSQIEILVVDDGSTDSTRQIIEAHAASDARVRAIIFDRNRGVVTARNAALEIASGEFVAMIDGDDVWLPTALEDRLSIADAFPEAVVIATEFTLFSGKVPPPPFAPKIAQGPRARAMLAEAYETKQAIVLPEPFEAVAMLHFAWVGATLVNRRTMEALGHFDPSFTGPEDTLLWLRLALKGPFVFLPSVTAFYRQRAGSIVTSLKGPKELHYLRVLDRVSQEPLSAAQRNTVRRLKAECHRVAAIAAAQAGERPAARAHAWLALKASPNSLGALRLLASTWLR